MKISYSTIMTAATTTLIAVATASAQGVGGNAGTVGQVGQNVTNIFGVVGGLVDMSIGILITLALATFFWGLVRYLFHLGGEKGADQGKHLMVYGIIALFVMVSVWGLVNFIQSFFGVGGGSYDVSNIKPRRQ